MRDTNAKEYSAGITRRDGKRTAHAKRATINRKRARSLKRTRKGL